MPEDPAASRNFTQLYQATLVRLRHYLARLLGNTAEAEDLAHDAFLRIKPVIDQKNARNPEALLYTTARRLAFNQLKRRRVSPVISGCQPAVDLASAPTPGVVQQVIARQEWSLLEDAISRLPSGCRTVLLLRKIELLSHQEIADRLGISISTVEKQHARALRLLRAELSPATQPAAPAAGTEAAP